MLIELITPVLFPRIFIGSKKQGLIVTNLKALFWKKSVNSTLENGESFTAQCKFRISIKILEHFSKKAFARLLRNHGITHLGKYDFMYILSLVIAPWPEVASRS